MTKRYITDINGNGFTTLTINLDEDGMYDFSCDEYGGERVFVRLSKDEFKQVFADMKQEMEVIETEEKDSRIVSMTGYELELKQAIEDEQRVLSVLRVMTDKEWYDSVPEWRRNVETRSGDIRIIERSIADMESEIRSFCNVVSGVY